MTASAPRAPPPSPPITTRAPMSMVRAVGRPPRGDAEDGGAEPLRLLDQMRGVVFATDDDRDLSGGFIVAQGGEHLESIELGDMNVEEDKIRRQRAGQPECRSTVRRHGNAIPVELELQL